MTHANEYNLVDVLKDKTIQLAKELGLSDIVTTKLDNAIINIRDNDSKCNCESCIKDGLSGSGTLPDNSNCPDPKCKGQLEYQETNTGSNDTEFKFYTCNKCKRTFTEEWKCVNWAETS